jgi:hypothetical protein
MNRPLYDPYFTHLPLLSAAMVIDATSRSSLPWLECGCGWYSTMLMRRTARAIGRQLVTLEAHQGWLDSFADLRTDWHQLEFIQDWRQSDRWRQRWGVAFIDHYPPLMRGLVLRGLVGLADLIVCHDADDPKAYDYGDFDGWTYRYEDRRLNPHTIILSNIHNVAVLCEES